MSTLLGEQEMPILVEFAPRPGVHETALSVAELAEKSSEALERAMGTIRQMAQRAQQMSAEMGYHWGQVDAAEVLAALSPEAAKSD